MADNNVTRIDPASLMRAPHFSQAVRVPAGADLLFIAGQVAGDGFGAIAADDFEAQVHTVFDRIEVILGASGMETRHLIKLNTYISDRQYLASYRKVFLARLGDIRPVSTLVIAALVDPGLLVEIEAVAGKTEA